MTAPGRPAHVQADKNPPQRRAVTKPLLTKKLFATESCVEKENQVFFSSNEITLAIPNTVLGRPHAQE